MEHNQAKKQIILISAETIGNNIDLLTDILLRLPVKPLVRFKCISKQWLSLISDPQFCLSHIRLHLTPTALLLKGVLCPSPNIEVAPLTQYSMPDVPIFDHLNSPHIQIMQSCNGLLLCLSHYNNQIRQFGRLLVFKESNYYICNPATNQIKSISFPSSEFKESLESVCMAFDPLKSNHYKLICVSIVEVEEEYRIDMYSSETDSWSMLGITITDIYTMDIAKPVYCNGMVHWFVEDDGEVGLYFDVNRECLDEMPMPNLAQHLALYFGESRGHLHLIVTEENPCPLQFDVLEMAADYSGWFVRYHVNLDPVRIAFPDIIWYDQGDHTFLVLDVIRTQREEDTTVVIYVGDKVISYNVHNGTSKKLCDVDANAYYTWRDTFRYFEILTFV